MHKFEAVILPNLRQMLGEEVGHAMGVSWPGRGGDKSWRDSTPVLKEVGL